MRPLPLLAALALAAPALAQTTAPDAVPMGEKPARPGTAEPTASRAPAQADPGMPADVHTTPPPVASQAPPPTADDTAPSESKGKGRARPSSTAKKRPQG